MQLLRDWLFTLCKLDDADMIKVIKYVENKISTMAFTILNKICE